MITEAEDILQEYNWREVSQIQQPLPMEKKQESGLRTVLLETLKAGCFRPEDELQRTGYTVQEINTELLLMQLEGVIEKQITGEYFIKGQRK